MAELPPKEHSHFADETMVSHRFPACSNSIAPDRYLEHLALARAARTSLSERAQNKGMSFMTRRIKVTTPVRSVKIAPDKRARLWKACLENRCIAVGWSEVGDLRRFRSPEELAAAMKAEFYPDSPGMALKKARELWVLTQLQRGDQVIANKGLSSMVGMGTVKKPAYSFGRRGVDGFRHIVAVDWHTVYDRPKRVPPQKEWNNTTVADVPPEVFEKLTGKALPQRSGIALLPLPSTRDGRVWTERSVALREGQPEFRRQVIELYGSRCAISSCATVDALEAAHIVPYKGKKSNQPWNGILLRADLHLLFDKNLLTIDPATLKVRLNRRLKGTEYSKFHGKPVRLPIRGSERLLKRLVKLRARELGAAA